MALYSYSLTQWRRKATKEKKSYKNSTKNTPVQSEQKYKLQLAEKIELMIKRMRWKTIMYDTGCK